MQPFSRYQCAIIAVVVNGINAAITVRPLPTVAINGQRPQPSAKPLDSPLPANPPAITLIHGPTQSLGTAFSQLAVTIPVIFAIMISAMGIAYATNHWLRRRKFEQEVAQYMAVHHPNAAVMMNMNTSQIQRRPRSGSRTVMQDQPSHMSYQTTNRSQLNTAVMNQMRFDAGGVGFHASQMMSPNSPMGAGSMPMTMPRQGNDPNNPYSTLVAYDATIFSLPGYLQMEFSNDLRLKGKVAEGGGGIVYKADLLNTELSQRFNVTACCVKIIKPLPNMAFNELKQTVYQEIAVMQALSHHANCITLLGYTEEPLSIVTKLYDRSLFNLVVAPAQYARHSPEFDAIRSFIKTDTRLRKGLIIKGFELFPEIAVHLSWGMANGMAEMHAKGILHRDLKSANVLLEYRPVHGNEKPQWMTDPNLSHMAQRMSGMLGQNSLVGGLGWGKDPQTGKPYCPVNPVICDFGLAKTIKAAPDDLEAGTWVKGLSVTSAVGISYRYAAPEAFNRMYHKHGQVEEAKPVDVYAFAVMVWEMLERRIPFGKISNAEIEARVKAGERPVISPQFRDINRPPDNNKHFALLVKIMQACWKQDPRERPTFLELKRRLRPFWLGNKDIQ